MIILGEQRRFSSDLESPSMVIDEKESENTNDMEEEVAPTRDTKVTAVDQSKTEVTSTAMVQQTLNSQFCLICFSLDRKRKQQPM